MNYKLQLISFLVSFLFGIFFYFTSLFNHKIIKKHSIVLQYLITFVYILDISLLYILLMYKVNYGVIHIYFIGMLFLGFAFGFVYCKKLRKFCKVKKNKLKE